MADCSGYGIATEILMCVNGPVGNGNRADLLITISNTSGDDFKEELLTVEDWDGTSVTVDISSDLNDFDGFTTANCDLQSATLSVLPDGGGNSGKLIMKFVLANCGEAAESGLPQVFENCGGAGPHVISEISTFTLDTPFCV